MNEQTPSTKGRENTAQVYDRVLARVDQALSRAESKTWRVIQEEIDKAVELEGDVAQLTREELDLLKAYMRRDIRDMRHYLHETGHGVADWLRLDLSLMEAKLRDLLFSIADKTRVEQVELEQRLQHDPGSYMAGEIACAGMLRCLNCDHMVCLVETTHIEPCHICGNHYFKRITARWPRDPELDAEVDADSPS